MDFRPEEKEKRGKEKERNSNRKTGFTRDYFSIQRSSSHKLDYLVCGSSLASASADYRGAGDAQAGPAKGKSSRTWDSEGGQGQGRHSGLVH